MILFYIKVKDFPLCLFCNFDIETLKRFSIYVQKPEWKSFGIKFALSVGENNIIKTDKLHLLNILMKTSYYLPYAANKVFFFIFI